MMLAGIGEAAPNARFGRNSGAGQGPLRDGIADLEGAAGVEAFCQSLCRAAFSGRPSAAA